MHGSAIAVAVGSRAYPLPLNESSRMLTKPRCLVSNSWLPKFLVLSFTLFFAQFFACSQMCSAQYQPRYRTGVYVQIDPAFGPANPVSPTIGPVGDFGSLPPHIVTGPASENHNHVALAVLLMAVLSCLLLLQRKKAAVWSLGACAAALMAISGCVWGLFGSG